VGADGRVAYSVGNQLYLGRVGSPAVLLSDAGGWTFDRTLFPGNFALYQAGVWLVAINGTLYSYPSA